MIFDKKYERALELEKEKKQLSREKMSDVQSGLETGDDRNEDDLSEHLEKGDLPAMLIAAVITFIPIGIIVLLAICAFAYFILF